VSGQAGRQEKEPISTDVHLNPPPSSAQHPIPAEGLRLLGYLLKSKENRKWSPWIKRRSTEQRPIYFPNIELLFRRKFFFLKKKRIWTWINGTFHTDVHDDEDEGDERTPSHPHYSRIRFLCTEINNRNLTLDQLPVLLPSTNSTKPLVNN